MKSLFTIILVLYHCCAYSQAFTKDFTINRLDIISSEAEKIDFIHDNFYKIYSADFDNADSLTSWAIEVSEMNNWPSKAAYAQLDKAVITYLKGQYDLALQHYLASEHLLDSLNDLEGLGKLNNEMAVFYHKQDQLEKAYACLDKSEEIARSIGNLVVLGTSLEHRGSFLTRRGKYDEAHPYFEEVMDIRIQTKDSIGLGYIYLNFAEYALFKENLDKALYYIGQSTDIRRQIGDEQGVAVNTVVMGEAYFDVGQFERAIPYFESTITLASAIGFTDLVRFTYDMLEKSHVELGNFQSAYNFQKLNNQLQDSLFNIEKSKVIGELQTKYETEKKDLQLAEQQVEIQRSYILLLASGILIFIILGVTLLIRNRHKRKQQYLIQQQEIELNKTQIQSAIESQEKERSRYARDLHDGFGQMISVLNMNLNGLETEKSKEKREQIFQNATNVLESMYQELRTICFNLMPQVLIKNGVGPAISEFADRINQSGKNQINVDIFGLDERLKEVQEISIYRITQEWVNNILKHSDADKITIQLTKDASELTLLIEDNGSGFDKNKLATGTGNGWKNMHSRANLIGAEIMVDIEKDRKGNTLILNVPLHEHSLALV